MTTETYDAIDEDSIGASKNAFGISILFLSSSIISDLEDSLIKAEDRAKKDWFVHQYTQIAEPEKDSITEGVLDDALKIMSINALSRSNAADMDKTRKNTGPLFFDVAFTYVAGIDLEHLVKTTFSKIEATPVNERNNKQLKGPITDESLSRNEIPDNPPLPDTPNKSGIWSFFGRGKK